MRGFQLRVFGLLTRLYPASFRRAYGREMRELFVRRLDRARAESAGAVGRLWLRTVVDLAGTALAERREAAEARRDHPMTETTMTTMIQDLREAARRLARTPWFTLAGVAIVALGIGVNTAAFAAVNAFLLRPPPFEDPSRVVNVYQDSDDGDPSSSSFPAYRDMAGYDRVFSGVAAMSPDQVVWEAEAGPVALGVEYVTASYFPVLGLEASLGRWFEPAHDQVGAGTWAVLNHRTWTERFGADPGWVGRTIRLNGHPVTVLGVGPEGFNGSAGALVTDAWLSISSVSLGGSFRVANLDRRQDHWYDVRARLAEGVTVEQAQAAMDQLAARLAQAYPELNRGRDITVFPTTDIRIHPEVDAGLRPAAALILGVVALVLLLACSNLANLLLVRGMARGSEVAVRRALGASRGRVAGLFLLEALLLSALGGAAGVAVAHWGVGLVPSVTVAGFPSTLDLGLDVRVLGFAVLLTLVTGGLFGLVPALRSTGMDLAGSLREDGRTATGGRGTSLFRNGMVAVQVAVSVVLLLGTGLLVRSLANLRSADPGVDADRVAYVGTSFAQAGIADGEAGALIQRLEERFGALPGVDEVALASRLPVQNRGGSTTTVVEGYTPPSGTGSVELLAAAVTPGYFGTVGIPVLEGRDFGPDDTPGTEPVVVVNETAARRYWPGESAVGRRIRPQSRPDAWIRVVGVVADSRVRTLGEGPTPLIYRPMAQTGVGSVYVLARTVGEPEALVDDLRRGLRQEEPRLSIAEIGTLGDVVEAGVAPSRTAALVLGSFSVLALLLASLGIYAVVSFTVARRRSELGIRIALGAERSRVVGMVLRDMLVTVGLGLVVGLAGAAAAGRVVQGFLFGVGGGDPVTFAVGSLLLASVAGVACWIPARRAARADPVGTLRAR